MTDRFRVTYWGINVIPDYDPWTMHAIASWRLTPQDAVDEVEAKGWRHCSPLIWAISRARANEDPDGWRHPAPTDPGLRSERSPWPPHPSGVQVIGRWMRRAPGWVFTAIVAVGWAMASALMHRALHR